MERVKQFYQIVLLDEYYNLTAEEFERFQKECSEIAAFKSHGANSCTHCLHQDQDTTEFDHVADEPDQLIELDQEIISNNRDFLLTKSAHKAIQAEAQQGMILQAEIDQMISKRLPDPDKMIDPQEEITTIDPVKTAMDVEILKQKVETMESPKKRGRPSKIAKDQKPLKKDAAVPPLDPEMDQIRKLAADKYGMAWADAKRIWCLGSDLTKEQVASVLPKANPEMVWWFYRDCHKGVEA